MRPICLFVFAALVFAPALGAQAHAFLDHAEPKVGAEVAKAPSLVRLSFSESLVLRFCHVTVTGPAGFGGAGPVRQAPGDSKSLIVDLRPPIPPGVYVVRWRVVSVDTHATEGDFAFKVKP